MKFFDLFAGIGGFRLGLEANGHKCIGSCEIDKYARKIYAKNFGSEPEYKDARDINTTELPDFDMIINATSIGLKEGDKFHIYPGLKHQMKALRDTELFEFSTKHFDEDSYRIINGD